MKLAASLTLAVALIVTPKLANSQASKGGTSEFPAVVRILPGSPPRVELINTGRQPMTAWRFVVSTPTATGIHRETHSADVYLSEVTGNLPGAQPHLDRIMPGQSRALVVDAAGADASVQLTAVVLQDGTGLGDPGALKAFFDHRAAERDQLHAVAEMFREVLAAKRGTAALEELKRRLQSGGEDSEPGRTARDAADALLRKAQAGGEEEADRSARSYSDFVAKQYETAVTHAVRKP